ncbi:MAG: DUF1365 domain-containing protein [Verrucomicrobia bacterium]|nr:DUF1365 domain-containing protein [Deltaproteobacteria bacterium]
MESRLYTGHVGHQRLTPIGNSFRYSLFFLYLDLAELENCFAERWFWSLERPNWASFRRSDHFRPATIPLDQAVRDEVGRQLGRRPNGPIRLLTHLRYLGYCFNPISIYYCFAADGHTLEAFLIEIHNTPWGEEYLRAFDAVNSPRDGQWYTFQLDKEFHVSPFMPMDISYDWRFSAPGEQLAVQMTSLRDGAEIFSASLNLQQQALSGGNLAGALLRWPFMTAKVIAAIYWQALRLKMKGVAYCPHPEVLDMRKGRFHQ